MLATVAFSTLVAIVTTGIQLFLDYKRELNHIDATFDQVDATYLPTIESALWATNRKEIQIALDGLTRLPDVRYAKVTEGDQVWAEAGADKRRSVKARSYRLQYAHLGKQVYIGDLRVVMDLEGVYQRLLDKFWVILITNSVKTFLVSGFMLWLFYWLVTRHLHQIAAFASRLGARNLHERLHLRRAERSGTDELDLVTNGFERMQRNLQEAMDALEADIRERVQVESALRRQRELLDKSQQIAQVGSFELEPVSGELRGSRQLFTLLGVTEDGFDGHYRSYLARVHEDDRAALISAHDAAVRQGVVEYESEHRIVQAATGTVRHVYQRCVPTITAGGDSGYVGMVQDITERKLADEQLRLAASVFRHSHQGIIITDADGVILDVNPAFTRVTGYTQADVAGKTPRVLSSGRHDRAWYARMWQRLGEEGHWRGEIWNRRKDGEVYPELQDISAVYDDHGRVINYVAVFSDITAQKQHEAELDRIAYYDVLTGLPNRRLLVDRLNQALPRSDREDRLLAIAYIDLDGFKAINDRFGHVVGDQVLVDVAERLLGTLRAGDTLARIGGDEFLLLLGDLEHVSACEASLDRLLASLSDPFKIESERLPLSASVGVTLYPLDDGTPDTLIRHADQAMYVAKHGGKNRYHFFDAHQDRQQQTHLASLQRLTDALHDEQFVLHYQPKLDLVQGQVLGVEALIRWAHPDRGVLGPNEFLDACAQQPLEIDIGWWVIKTALKQLAAWQQAGLDWPISVNISAYHLLSPDFVQRLRNTLAAFPSVQPASLELEVLETSAMRDISQAIAVLTACKKLGVMLALDDFGTGYSSLAYVRQLPVDVLKIDRGFIRNMHEDAQGKALVESVVRIAELFGCESIAEGVETLAQARTLVELGCANGQGFLMARPMPADMLPDWLSQWNDNALWCAIAETETEEAASQLR